MDFAPGPEDAAMIEVARRVADTLAPGYVERDRSGAYPWEPLALLGKAGLLGLNAPEEAGGAGAGELVTGLVCEVLGRADYTLPILVMEAGSTVKLLHHAGSPEVATRWVPEIVAGRATVGLGFTEPGAGSDLSAAVSTRARPDGGD